MLDQPEKRKILTNAERYDLARSTAKAKRLEFGVKTENISIPFLKKICKKEGIKVDLIGRGSKIRAAYFLDEYGCSIMLAKSLPREPKLFALAHELKHHFLDRDLIESGTIECGDYNKNKEIEIAAEIFAAEFLFPEDEMRVFIDSLGIKSGNCVENDIIEIKRNSPVPISYSFICKRLSWFNFIKKDQFSNTYFQKLEEELYPPIYKQAWFKNKRKKKLEVKPVLPI